MRISINDMRDKQRKTGLFFVYWWIILIFAVDND